MSKPGRSRSLMLSQPLADSLSFNIGTTDRFFSFAYLSMAWQGWQVQGSSGIPYLVALIVSHLVWLPDALMFPLKMVVFQCQVQVVRVGGWLKKRDKNRLIFLSCLNLPQPLIVRFSKDKITQRLEFVNGSIHTLRPKQAIYCMRSESNVAGTKNQIVSTEYLFPRSHSQHIYASKINSLQCQHVAHKLLIQAIANVQMSGFTSHARSGFSSSIQTWHILTSCKPCHTAPQNTPRCLRISETCFVEALDPMEITGSGWRIIPLE